MRAIIIISSCLCALFANAQTAASGKTALDKAAEYMLQERWQAAKDIYNAVLQAEPDNHTALYFRAYANERLLHYGLARADYNAILGADPLNYHALMGRATLNQKDCRYTEALDDANLLVEHHKDSIDAWLTRAAIEEQQKLLPLAEYDYEYAYSLDPTRRELILRAIDIKLRLKKKKEAKRCLDTLVKNGAPKNSLMYYYKRINARNP